MVRNNTTYLEEEPQPTKKRFGTRHANSSKIPWNGVKMLVVKVDDYGLVEKQKVLYLWYPPIHWWRLMIIHWWRLIRVAKTCAWLQTVMPTLVLIKYKKSGKEFRLLQSVYLQNCGLSYFWRVNSRASSKNLKNARQQWSGVFMKCQVCKKKDCAALLLAVGMSS